LAVLEDVSDHFPFVVSKQAEPCSLSRTTKWGVYYGKP